MFTIRPHSSTNTLKVYIHGGNIVAWNKTFSELILSNLINNQNSAPQKQICKDYEVKLVLKGQFIFLRKGATEG